MQKYTPRKNLIISKPFRKGRGGMLTFGASHPMFKIAETVGKRCFRIKRTTLYLEYFLSFFDSFPFWCHKKKEKVREKFQKNFMTSSGIGPPIFYYWILYILDWVPIKVSCLSPLTIDSKLIEEGCSDRWLPTCSIFSHFNSHLNYFMSRYSINQSMLA